MYVQVQLAYIKNVSQGQCDVNFIQMKLFNRVVFERERE